MADQDFSPKLLRNYAVVILTAWTALLGLSLYWHYRTMASGSLDAARLEARNAILNIVVYRSWNASHGGVYARVTKDTTPNPYLTVPERDIQTPSGTRLTLINPAYMTRQANELAFRRFGQIGHITSLNPIRPENRADAWEADALRRFERGEKEVSSLETINGEAFLRMMHPLMTEKNCLTCHAEQGYKEGDIRGGLGVAIPMARHAAIEKESLSHFMLMYFTIWIVGLSGTLLFMMVLNAQIRKRFKAEDELRSREKMEGVVEMARAVCHELNQPLQTILGNSEIIMMDDVDPETIQKRVGQIKDQVNRMGKMTQKLIKIASYETKDMPQGKVIDIDKSSK